MNTYIQLDHFAAELSGLKQHNCCSIVVNLFTKFDYSLYEMHCFHYMGIAQIALSTPTPTPHPPPSIKRSLWSTFFGPYFLSVLLTLPK